MMTKGTHKIVLLSNYIILQCHKNKQECQTVTKIVEEGLAEWGSNIRAWHGDLAALEIQGSS